jgi:hypothetical protein
MESETKILNAELDSHLIAGAFAATFDDEATDSEQQDRAFRCGGKLV